MDDALLPVLALAPLDLPPPSGDLGPNKSLASRALLSILLLVGVLVVGLGLIAGLVLLNIAFIIGTGRIYLTLILVTLAVVMSIGKGLLAAVKKPDEPDDEFLVPREAEPALHAMVEELAATVGTRPPDRIVLVPVVNAYVREFGPFMGLVRGERTLAIGGPLLDVLSVSQLRAVLAHELGHFAGGDTKLGPINFRTEQCILRILQSLRGNVTVYAFVAYAGFQQKVSRSTRRAQELTADRAAVRVAGRQAAAEALRALEIAGRAENLLRQQYLTPLLAAGYRPTDVGEGVRSLLADSTRLAELSDPQRDAAPKDDPWASHPPTPQRIARIAQLPDTATVTSDPRAARVIFRAPDYALAAVNDQWLHRITQGKPLQVVPWTALADLVVTPVHRRRCADVDRALAQRGVPSGLAGVHTAVEGGHDRDLAAALVAAGWRAPGADERGALLRSAVTSELVCAALDNGWSWQFSWSQPAMLVAPSGETVDLKHMSAAAVQGDWVPVGSLGLEEPPPANLDGATSHDPLVAAWSETDDTPRSEVAPAVPSGHPASAIPAPPCPPFEPGSDAWRWDVRLPGTLGKKVLVSIADDAIRFGSTVMLYDDITNISIGPRQDGAAFAIAAGSKAKVKETPTGATVKSKREISLASQYLWKLLSQTVVPRRCREVEAQVRNGEQVAVGGLVLSSKGVAVGRSAKAVYPWAGVGDLRAQNQGFLLPVNDYRVLTLKQGEHDAILLPRLIPQLRALYS